MGLFKCISQRGVGPLEQQKTAICSKSGPNKSNTLECYNYVHVAVLLYSFLCDKTRLLAAREHLWQAVTAQIQYFVISLVHLFMTLCFRMGSFHVGAKLPKFLLEQISINSTKGMHFVFF